MDLITGGRTCPSEEVILGKHHYTVFFVVSTLLHYLIATFRLTRPL